MQQKFLKKSNRIKLSLFSFSTSKLLFRTKKSYQLNLLMNQNWLFLSKQHTLKKHDESADQLNVASFKLTMKPRLNYQTESTLYCAVGCSNYLCI